MSFLETLGAMLGISMAITPGFGGNIGIGNLNPWIYSGGQVKVASTTADLQIPSLTNCDTIDTDGNGIFSCGTDETGGGGGAGTVGTSTTPSISGLATWTTSGAFPELLGTTATSALTVASPLSLSNPISVIGSASSEITLSTAGDWTGTFDGQEGSYYLNAANLTNFGTPFFTFFSATTTTALAEGTNLYWTNTRFDNRLSATTTLPNLTTLANLSITESQISDLGAYLTSVDISANTNLAASYPVVLTGDTLSLAFGTTTANSWSALQTFAAATSTNLGITNSLSFGGVTGNAWTDFCETITGGAGLCDGVDSTGAGGTGLATSTDIVDDRVIVGTSASDVGSYSTLTFNNLTNLLTVTNASTTLFSTSYASSTLFYGAGLAACGTNSWLAWATGAYSCASLDTTGTWSGNAGTATALAANGANCSAGNAPLGVDASGAVESCFDVWTEAENTAAGYGTGSVTSIATTYPVTGGPITTTGTIALAFGTTTANSWSALQTFAAATSTDLGITNSFSFGGVTGAAWTDFCTTITGSADLCDGSDATGSGIDGYDFSYNQDLGYGITGSATSTATKFSLGIVASSTSYFSNATSTLHTITGSLWAPTLTSALLLTDANGLFAEYAGTSCTNQFVRALSVLGAATCADVTLGTDTTGNYVATIADAGNSTITVTGSGSESAAVTLNVVDVNCTDCLGTTEIADSYLLNNGDVGTGTYDFGDAVVEVGNGTAPTVTTTGVIAVDTSSPGQLVWSYNGSTVGVTVPFANIVAGHATSTWVGTTTQYLAPAPGAITVVSARCETSTGTVGVSLYDGTNRANFFTASTTSGTITYSTNNTFTDGESMRVDFGTPASSPTQAVCRFRYTYTRQ